MVRKLRLARMAADVNVLAQLRAKLQEDVSREGGPPHEGPSAERFAAWVRARAYACVQ